jgi:DNA-binding transcriptional ArsR family regulator
MANESSGVRRGRRALSDHPLHRVVAHLDKALCAPARLDIVQSLQASELSVTDLATIIKRTRSATSQHLSVLRRAGLVEGIRQGMTVLYRLPATADGERLRNILVQLKLNAGALS